VNQDGEKYYDRYFTQREKARIHKDDIIYALRVLGKATSGKIEQYIRDIIISEIQEQIESNAWNKLEGESLQRVLENHKQCKRTIQDWLPKLEAEGLVTKNEHYEYSLTDKGKKLDIYPDIYGRMLLSSLINLPWHKTKEKNIVEFAKRIGIFMLYIFINNLHGELQSSTHVTAAEILDKKNLTWIKDTIRSDLMFFSFEKVFLGTMSKSQRQRLFIFDEGDYYKLLDIFEAQFPRYHKVLRNAESIFSEKVIKRQT
jgi:predicted transcriptional regulator